MSTISFLLLLVGAVAVWFGWCFSEVAAVHRALDKAVDKRTPTQRALDNYVTLHGFTVAGYTSPSEARSVGRVMDRLSRRQKRASHLELSP